MVDLCTKVNEFGKAMSNVARYRIIEALLKGEKTGSELVKIVKLTQPAVSQHLKVLKDAGLVAEHAEGTRRIYQLNEAGLTALRDQLDTFWNRALSGYQHVIDEPTKENP